MINHIRIGEDIFISFGDTVSSIGFNGLPKDVHLSLSYSPGKPLNFHVSRNIGDGTNKPHISVCKVDKTVTETVLQVFGSEIFRLSLQPLDLSYYQRSHRRGRMSNLKFLSLYHFEKQKVYRVFRNDLTIVFRKHSTIKKKRRLRIHSSIKEGLVAWAQNSETKNKVMAGLVGLQRKFKQPTDMGVLITPVFKGNVIRINDRFYIFRKDIEPMHLVNALFGPELARHLIFKTRLAIQRIKNAANYQETEKFNKPVLLDYKLIIE